MNKNKEMNIGLTAIAQFLIAVASIVHLIFTYIHTNALLLLVNEICGFIMFVFVLCSVITLFEATQIKNHSVQIKIITAILCFLTTAMGKLLVDIYRDAIINQNGLQVVNVEKAVGFSLLQMIAFSIAGALLVLDIIRTQKREKHARREIF